MASDDLTPNSINDLTPNPINDLVKPGILSPDPNNKHAYVWLFMKGDSYLPGIFTSVFSVSRTNPNADLVVMVTNDISQAARKILKKVATHLYDIPYISFESKRMKTDRQQKMYENWIATSYSKWNALALPYDKIILVDGDTIHTENTDELFDLQAPACPFASPFIKPMGYIESHYTDLPSGRDGYPLHNTQVPTNLILDTLNLGGVVLTSTPVLIEPSVDDFYAYQQMVKSMQPFGFPKCHSMLDEQSIAYFYASVKKQSFTTIHQRYNYYPWKDKFLFHGDVPRIIHFFSDTKPWSIKFDAYPDVICWYKMAALGIETVKIKPNDIALTQENVESAKKATDTYIKKFIRVVDVTSILGKLKR